MSTFETFSDDELVELLSKGHKEAFTEIYKRYHAALYIHVFNKLRNREEARDIIQELFASLWNNHTTYVIQTGLSAYLFTSARYKVFDYISRKGVIERHLSSIVYIIDRQEIITDHLVREKLMTSIINDEIASLPKKMREIFELSRKEHLTHKQIGSLLGLSEMTIKKQVNNALKILRSRLGDQM